MSINDLLTLSISELHSIYGGAKKHKNIVEIEEYEFNEYGENEDSTLEKIGHNFDDNINDNNDNDDFNEDNLMDDLDAFDKENVGNEFDEENTMNDLAAFDDEVDLDIIGGTIDDDEFVLEGSTLNDFDE